MSRLGGLPSPLPAEASPVAQADAHACLLDALKLPGAAILGGSAGAPSAVEFLPAPPGRYSPTALPLPVFFPAGATPLPPAAAPPLISLLVVPLFLFLSLFTV